MRLFVSIQLNNKMKTAIADLQEQMQRLGVRGNFTRCENLHLTLAFIGEYADPEDVITALEPIRFDPFQIRLNGIGSFGNLWWTGLDENDELKKLVKRVRCALADAGIPFDRKKFLPHITLIRKPICRSGRIPEEILRRSPQASMMVDHISLMRSDRGKHGMIYTELW